MLFFILTANRFSHSSESWEKFISGPAHFLSPAVTSPAVVIYFLRSVVSGHHIAANRFQCSWIFTTLICFSSCVAARGTTSAHLSFFKQDSWGPPGESLSIQHFISCILVNLLNKYSLSSRLYVTAQMCFSGISAHVQNSLCFHLTQIRASEWFRFISTVLLSLTREVQAGLF